MPQFTKTVTVGGKRYRVTTRRDPTLLDVAGPGIVASIAMPYVPLSDAKALKQAVSDAVERDRQNHARATAAVVQRVKDGTAGLSK